MPGLTYVSSTDCLVLPLSGQGLDIYCVDLSGLVLAPNCWAPGFVVRQSGTKARSLWLYPEGGSSSAWQNFATTDQLEYCQDDGNLYALDTYTTGPCRLFRLKPPPAGQLSTGVWEWASEVLIPKSSERLALREMPYSLATDTRLYGKMRYVSLLKSFVFSDYDKLPVQALRPRAFA
jgi:hypothetical protein